MLKPDSAPKRESHPLARYGLGATVLLISLDSNQPLEPQHLAENRGSSGWCLTEEQIAMLGQGVRFRRRSEREIRFRSLDGSDMTRSSIGNLTAGSPEALQVVLI